MCVCERVCVFVNTLHSEDQNEGLTINVGTFGLVLLGSGCYKA